MLGALILIAIVPWLIARQGDRRVVRNGKVLSIFASV